MAILEKPLSAQKKQMMLDRVAFHAKERTERKERIKTGEASSSDKKIDQAERKGVDLAKRGVLTEYMT